MILGSLKRALGSLGAQLGGLLGLGTAPVVHIAARLDGDVVVTRSLAGTTYITRSLSSDTSITRTLTGDAIV